MNPIAAEATPQYRGVVCHPTLKCTQARPLAALVVRWLVDQLAQTLGQMPKFTSELDADFVAMKLV